MGIIAMIVTGLVIGLLARLLMPGPDPAGFLLTIVLGIAGAFVGGMLGRVLGMYAPGQPAGLIMSIIGAMLLLVLHRTLRGRSA